MFASSQHCLTHAGSQPSFLPSVPFDCAFTILWEWLCKWIKWMWRRSPGFPNFNLQKIDDLEAHLYVWPTIYYTLVHISTSMALCACRWHAEQFPPRLVKWFYEFQKQAIKTRLHNHSCNQCNCQKAFKWCPSSNTARKVLTTQGEEDLMNIKHWPPLDRQRFT